MTYLLALIIIFISTVSGTEIPKSVGYSKSQTESLRGKIVSQIRSECQSIEKIGKPGESEKVLYKNSVNVLSRNFAINDKSSSCVFGPILKETEDELNIFKRTLNSNEVSLYEKYGRLGAIFIKGIEVGDGILRTETTTKRGNTVISVEVSHALVSDIVNVSFSCPSDKFCCGLFCCPQPIQSFLSEQRNISDATKKSTDVVISIDNLRMSMSPILEGNKSTVARQCEFEMDTKDEQDITSVFYQCSDEEKPDCCSEQLCCEKPISNIFQSGPGNSESYGKQYVVVIAVIAVIVLIVVLGLCLRRRSKSQTQNGATRNVYAKVNTNRV